MSAVNDPKPPTAPQTTSPAAEAIQTAPPPAAASTGIQAGPPVDAPPVPLPPRPRPDPITPEELGRAMTRLDRMLVGVVLVLTALAALFPIHNSDFWLHLATARDWLGNKISLGQNPYSFNGTGLWVNHSWLFDVILYGLYQTLGGPGVVVVKAVLLLTLAVLMLSIRRPNQSLWLPGVCTALAILAMSPSFLMQPAIVSFVLLGVTLLLLMRRDLRDEPEVERKHRAATPVPWLGEPTDRALWLLVPLFVLWINLDAWFFVGPFAVALYLAGSLAHAFFAQGKPNPPRPGAWRPLAAVLAVGVLACLLNPFGYHALILPGEIGAREVLKRLGDDEVFARLLSSPIEREYFLPETGLNVAGMAYFPLVLIGLVSFLLAGARVRWGRAVLWGGFFVLSLGNARAISFFAVVAGPIAALNFQEYAARRFGTKPIAIGWLKEWSLAGRGLSVIAVFMLALLAWPGWLFALPWEDRPQAAEERRVALGMARAQWAEPPPGLVKLARQLDEWQSDGTLNDNDRAFNLQPDVAGPLAWMCKEYRPKCFFDNHYENYSPEAAGEYVDLRRLFDPPDDTDPTKLKSLFDEKDKWLPILAKNKVTYIIVSDGPRGNYPWVRKWCAGISGSPSLVTLYQDGHAAVFAPREKSLSKRPNEYLAWMRSRRIELPSLPPPTQDNGRFKGKEYDAWDLAYGPKAEPLPEQKPRRTRELPWYVRFAFGTGSQPAEAADADAYRSAGEETAFRHHYEDVMRPWAASNFATLTLFGGIRNGNPLADAWSFGAPFHYEMFRQAPPVEQDDYGPIFITPSAPLMLAVRSARRAILKNPEDAEAYFQLGRAYFALSRQGEEHHLGQRMSLLSQVRQVQMVSALRNAVLLEPDHMGAHTLLAFLFQRAGYADLQLKHLKEQIRVARRNLPRSAKALELFQEHIKAKEEEQTKLEKSVKDNQNTFAVRSEKKKVMDKARIALELHLGEKALQVLLDSDPLEFGKEGAQMELHLLMQMGDLEKLRVQLAPDNDEKLRKELPEALSSLGVGAFELYRMLLAVGEGDYQEADDFLKQAQQKMIGDPDMIKDVRSPLLVPGPVTEQVLHDPELVKRLSGVLSLTDEPGPAKDLKLPQLVVGAVAELIAEYAPRQGPVMWLLLLRLEEIRREGRLSQMAKPLEAAADFETLRGLLKIETGNIAEAKQHLRKALYGKEDQANLDAPIVLNFPGVLVANRYLRAMEKKEEKKE